MHAIYKWAAALPSKVRTGAMIAVLAFSVFSTFVGAAALLRFSGTPGESGKTPERWPAESAVRRPGGQLELLVFVHPFCSCTSATVAELATLAAEGPLPAIRFLFYRPENSNWTRNSLWAEAERLPGAGLQWDEGGREARRFGARTSGFVLLYSSTGRLLFSGGVTGSRGHQGGNYGIRQLSESIRSGKAASKSGFVFGCALGEIS